MYFVSYDFLFLKILFIDFSPVWELIQRPFSSLTGTQSTEPHQPELI